MSILRVYAADDPAEGWLRDVQVFWEGECDTGSVDLCCVWEVGAPRASGNRSGRDGMVTCDSWSRIRECKWVGVLTPNSDVSTCENGTSKSRGPIAAPDSQTHRVAKPSKSFATKRSRS